MVNKNYPILVYNMHDSYLPTLSAAIIKTTIFIWSPSNIHHHLLVLQHLKTNKYHETQNVFIVSNKS